MAAFTSKAAGNWSASGQTTWTQTGVPGSGDTVTVNHAILVDVDTTFDGGAVNANLTVADGNTLTVQGNVTQLSCTFTLGAGSTLRFATAGGNRTWTLDRTCPFVVNGTNSAHAVIQKTGSNYAWFPGAGTAFDRPAWDVIYCDFTGIGGSGGAFSLTGRNGGFDAQRIRHCTFNTCGPVFGDHLQFDTAGNKNYQIEDCLWSNSTGTISIYVDAVGSAGNGSGTKTILGCAFDKAPSIHAPGFTCDDNYFHVGAPDSYLLASFARNLVCLNSNAETFTIPSSNATDLYMLADHVDVSDRINGTTGVGNPHFLIYTSTPTPTFDGLILEYPHYSAIDTGDGFLHSTGMVNGTIKNSLVLPSMADGNLSGSLYSSEHATTGVKLLHNTVIGKYCQLAFDEVSSGSGDGTITEMKSNLVIGTVASGGANSAFAFEDVFCDIGGHLPNAVDTVIPTGVKNNYIHNPFVYTDVGGHAHPGFHGSLSASPDGTNTLVYGGSGPNFVDTARNLATWGVSKGVATGGNMATNSIRRAALDATRAYLLLNPRLVGSELIPWVRAGFAPQNAVLQNAGHDGVTIGAVAFVTTGATVSKRKRFGLTPNRTTTLFAYGTPSVGPGSTYSRRKRFGLTPNRTASLVSVSGAGMTGSTTKTGAQLVRPSATVPTIFGA